MKEPCVYILSNSAAILYIGMTTDLSSRLFQHTEHHDPDSFASRYNLDRLVFVEDFPTVLEAIAREKQLKRWTRAKKLKLIRKHNPEWRDLSAHYVSFPPAPSSGS